MTLPRFLCLAVLLSLGMQSTIAQEATLPAESGDTVIFLVRHAEKADDDPRDPSLTEDGQERAWRLARVLSDAGLTYIHSTDYRRTRDTVAPIVSETGLQLDFYDLRDLSGFADRLRRTPGRHLVSGHSNTTPQLGDLLGGEPGKPIVEATEYDRLYVVTIGTDGSVSTVLLRFGP